jgi:hypothetical protein
VVQALFGVIAADSLPSLPGWASNGAVTGGVRSFLARPPATGCHAFGIAEAPFLIVGGFNWSPNSLVFTLSPEYSAPVFITPEATAKADGSEASLIEFAPV